MTYPEMWYCAGSQIRRRGRTPIDVATIPEAFVIGTDEPTWANSGSRIAQASLTTDPTINLVTTADNQTISGVYLPAGRIEVRHKNVTIRDCIINVGWAPNGSSAGQRLKVQGNPGIIHNPSYDTTGNLIEYVTIDPVNAGANNTADDAAVGGIFGYGFTARRNAIRNVTDALMPDVRTGYTAPVLAEGNYCQTRWLPYDPEQTDGTHNDGIQLAGATGDVVRGNTFKNPTGGVTDPGSGFTVRGQCIVFTPYHGAIDNTVIEYNWCYGAYTQIAAWVPTAYGPQPQNVTIKGNRHMGQCVWMILITPAVNTAKADISGNVVGAGGCTFNSGARSAGTAADVNITSAG